VENGDMIELDVKNRRLTLEVPDRELGKRRAAWNPTAAAADRGYVNLYLRHVEQAERGCDFDFLKGASGDEVLRDCH
jgi:dihydroxy-acid dehydratase